MQNASSTPIRQRIVLQFLVGGVKATLRKNAEYARIGTSGGGAIASKPRVY